MFSKEITYPAWRNYKRERFSGHIHSALARESMNQFKLVNIDKQPAWTGETAQYGRMLAT